MATKWHKCQHCDGRTKCDCGSCRVYIGTGYDNYVTDLALFAMEKEVIILIQKLVNLLPDLLVIITKEDGNKPPDNNENC